MTNVHFENVIDSAKRIFDDYKQNIHHFVRVRRMDSSDAGTTIHQIQEHDGVIGLFSFVTGFQPLLEVAVDPEVVEVEFVI